MIQLLRNSSDFMGNGVFVDPDELSQEILRNAPTNNIYCERPFAMMGRKMDLHIGGDPHTIGKGVSQEQHSTIPL